jgi:hypothetical protein
VQGRKKGKGKIAEGKIKKRYQKSTRHCFEIRNSLPTSFWFAIPAAVVIKGMEGMNLN